MSKYTWVITEDDTPGELSGMFAKIGPSGAKDRLSLGQVIQDGEHFRLVGNQHEVLFTGYIHGEYSGPEPLDDYGRDFACVDIEYEVGDRWAALDGSTREPIIS